MRVFVDANIIVALLNKELPVFNYAARIFSLPQNRVKLFTTPICLAIAFYFAEKKSGRKLALQKLTLLIHHLEIAECDKDGVNRTLTNKRIADFEDGLEYYAALKSGCQFIITEDASDFYFSEIQVFNAQQFLLHYIQHIKK